VPNLYIFRSHLHRLEVAMDPARCYSATTSPNYTSVFAVLALLALTFNFL